MPELFYAGYGNSKYAGVIHDANIRYGSLYRWQSKRSVYKSWYAPEVVSIPAEDIDGKVADWLHNFGDKAIDVVITDINDAATVQRAGLFSEWYRSQEYTGLVVAEPTSSIILESVLDYLDSEVFDTVAYAPAKDKSGEVLKGLEGFDAAFWLTKGYPHQQMAAANRLGLDNIHYIDITPAQIMAAYHLVWYHWKIPKAINKWFCTLEEMGEEWSPEKGGKAYRCLELSIRNTRQALDEIYSPPPPGRR